MQLIPTSSDKPSRKLGLFYRRFGYINSNQLKEHTIRIDAQVKLI